MYCKKPEEKIKMDKTTMRIIVCQTATQTNLFSVPRHNMYCIKTEKKIKIENTIMRIFVCETPKHRTYYCAR